MTEIVLLTVDCNDCYVESRNNTFGLGWANEIGFCRGYSGPVIEVVNNLFCDYWIYCEPPELGDLSIDFRHNFFCGGSIPASCNATVGEGNLWGDAWPMLCDFEACDYRPRPDTPLADGGEDGGPIGAWPVGCGPTEVPDNVPVFGRGLTVFPAAPTLASGTVRLPVLVTDPQEVHVGIFDATGRLVRDLGDLRVTNDTREITWDGLTSVGSAAPSGTYFVRVEGARLARSVKVVILR